MSADLIEMLNATGKWWVIGHGKSDEEDETVFWCNISEPHFEGSPISFTEGNDLADCVVRAIAELEESKMEAET